MGVKGENGKRHGWRDASLRLPFFLVPALWAALTALLALSCSSPPAGPGGEIVPPAPQSQPSPGDNVSLSALAWDLEAGALGRQLSNFLEKYPMVRFGFEKRGDLGP